MKDYETTEQMERSLKRELRLLESVRKSIGLRKSEFAGELGIAFTTYSRWLHNKSNCPDDLWKSVCANVQRLLEE